MVLEGPPVIPLGSLGGPVGGPWRSLGVPGGPLGDPLGDPWLPEGLEVLPCAIKTSVSFAPLTI